MYAGELQLAADPPLGDWRINVETASGVRFGKGFTVDRYVLPKFEVCCRFRSLIALNLAHNLKRKNGVK